VKLKEFSSPLGFDTLKRTRPLSTHNDEIEILIGRLVDNQANDEDRRAFESLAESDPQLWRRLALRQQDMAALSMHVEPHLRSADRIDLPADAAPPVSRMTIRISSWALAISGWAAMVALAVIWSMTPGRSAPLNQDTNTAVPIAATPTDLSPDDYLHLYLAKGKDVGYVLDEMPPTMLEVQVLPDGRKAVRYIRRIEEVLFLPPDQDVPVDDDGILTKPPSELRGEESAHNNPG